VISERVRQIHRLLRTHQCDAILVSDPADVAYLSGFESSSIHALLTRTDRLLFSDFRYAVAARTFCRRNPAWRFVEVSERSLSFVAQAVPAGGRVGIQPAALTVDKYDHLRRDNGDISFVKLDQAASTLSMRKLPAEIRAMRRAAAIGDRALASLLPRLRLGMSESETARMLEILCLHGGSEGPAFDTIVLFGDRSALPHGRPSSRRLRMGDWILIDFGCRCRGLCSDMTRTLVAGPASQRQKSLYAVVRHAQSAARRAALPGIPAKQLDAAAREPIAAAGYAAQFGHATGHGVGRVIHEKPRIAAADATILKENMVVTIEPGIYIPKFGGVRLEDMVVICAGGALPLTHSPRRLIELAL
jgi:Xaa-Pro aminopeptidase